MPTTTINFSVIIPLYNKEGYIKRAIDSVLNQTHKNLELIIINDGSTDNSLSVVKSINDNRVKIVSQPNSGVSAARNKGILLASFNWLALLDGDDEWEPDFLEEIRNAIQVNSSCIAYASGFKKIEINGGIHFSNTKYLPEKQGVIENYFKSLYHNGPTLTSSSVCLNKNLLKTKGIIPLFPIDAKRGEDLDAWTRIALQNDIYFINKILVNIYAVQESTTHRTKYKHQESFDYYRWLTYKADSESKMNYLKKFVFIKNWRIIKILIKQNQFRIAFTVFIEYLKKR